jgi:lipid A ethanolaminephosphotransferase
MSSVFARDGGSPVSPAPTLSESIWSPRSPLRLALLAALWIAGPCNWPLWAALFTLPEAGTLRGGLFMPGLGLMITALSAGFMALFAWRYTLKPVIAILLLSAALGAYFMGSYGVVIDPTMMFNVMGTDPREMRDLLSLPLVASVVGLAAVPILWMWQRPITYGRWPRRSLHNALAVLGSLVALALLALAFYQDLSGTMRNHKALRYLVNPANSYYSLGRVAYLTRVHTANPPLPIGLDAKPLARLPGQRTPLLLLVVGETARADHFSINGYARDTTPRLRALHALSFSDVTSCGTNTAASLPCMLSHQGKVAHEARSNDHENLLDLLQHAGLAVLWIENQAGCKGVCERVPHTRPETPASGAAAPDAKLCPGGECLDEAMLQGLDARLAALPADRRERGVVLVLHQMGSHGPAYSSRSPADRKPFQPECTSNVLHECDPVQLVNAYDNSIAYTDFVLDQAVGWLKTQQTVYDPAMLYLSDHGESLGERGLYLHGLPYSIAPREQTHVPMVAWLPEQRLRADRLDGGCLRTLLDRPLTHDNLFHTVLGLARVEASEFQPALDAFGPCRGG